MREEICMLHIIYRFSFIYSCRSCQHQQPQCIHTLFSSRLRLISCKEAKGKGGKKKKKKKSGEKEKKEKKEPTLP